jgi:hypothetical protein
VTDSGNDSLGSILLGTGSFYLCHHIQTGSGVHPPFYSMGITGSFLGHKVAGLWSWPPASIFCYGVGCVELYIRTPYLLLLYGAYEQRQLLSFTFVVLSCNSTECCHCTVVAEEHLDSLLKSLVKEPLTNPNTDESLNDASSTCGAANKTDGEFLLFLMSWCYHHY